MDRILFLSKAIASTQEGYQRINEAAAICGMTVKELPSSGPLLARDIKIPEGCEVYALTSLGHQRVLSQACRGALPGPLYCDAHYQANVILGYFGDIALNDSGAMLPLGALGQGRRLRQIRRCFGSEIFIRPVSGRKAFPGQTLTLDESDIDLFLSTYRLHQSLEMMVLIAPARQDIISEKRHFLNIETRTCIASSLYGHAGEAVGPNFDATETLRHLYRGGMQFADLPMLVCDVALLADGSQKLIELNAFSTSGLYDCEPENILRSYIDFAKRFYHVES